MFQRDTKFLEDAAIAVELRPDIRQRAEILRAVLTNRLHGLIHQRIEQAVGREDDAVAQSDWRELRL